MNMILSKRCVVERAVDFMTFDDVLQRFRKK